MKRNNYTVIIMAGDSIYKEDKVIRKTFYKTTRNEAIDKAEKIVAELEREYKCAWIEDVR